jgi:hypothetical protein
MLTCTPGATTAVATATPQQQTFGGNVPARSRIRKGCTEVDSWSASCGEGGARSSDGVLPGPL